MLRAFLIFILLNAAPGAVLASGGSLKQASKLLDRNYYELLSAAPGGSGLFVGVPGDPMTVGVTLKMSLRRN